MDLSKDVVDGIMTVLLEEEYITYSEIPDGFKGKKELCEYWIGESEKAWINEPTFARKDPAIQYILNVSPNGIPVVSNESPFNASILGLEDKLPVPREVDFEYKNLPSDFTELSDLEIRKYSSHNQHFLNRARFLLANVVNHLADANHLKDQAYRKGYRETYDELEEDKGKAPTRDLVDSYVIIDDAYVMYDTDARAAQDKVNMYKALVEIYSGNVDRLSREWTMRQNEWERNK